MAVKHPEVLGLPWASQRKEKKLCMSTHSCMFAAPKTIDVPILKIEKMKYLENLECIGGGVVFKVNSDIWE